MSDVMLFGVLQMPYEMAMTDELSRRQYWQRGQQAADEITRLRAEVARLTEEKADAISTLNAWFDRRKLGHDAVDAAIIDAAKGYLRTSRIGGMPCESSDMVETVIADMARLGVFADIYARAALGDTP